MASLHTFKCLMIRRMKCNLNAICFCISVRWDRCFYPDALAALSAFTPQPGPLLGVLVTRCVPTGEAAPTLHHPGVKEASFNTRLTDKDLKYSWNRNLYPLTSSRAHRGIKGAEELRSYWPPRTVAQTQKRRAFISNIQSLREKGSAA